MKNLIEYKAGLMVLHDRMVEPDSRRGLLYLSRIENEIHICWKDRETGQVEMDIRAVPGVPRFQRVRQVTTGRVFVLRFANAKQRHFFWMQESFPEHDDDFCRRFNELITASKEPEPPKIELHDSGRPRDGGGSEAAPAALSPSNGIVLAMSILGFFLKMGSSLISVFTNAMVPEGQSPQPFEDPDPPPLRNLASILRRQMSNSIESMNFTPDSLNRLMDRLPMDADREEIESQATAAPPSVMDTLKVGVAADHVRSAQFYEALLEFEYAFQHCQLADSLEALSLGPEALETAQYGDLEGFLWVLNGPGAFIQDQEDTN